MLEATAVDGLDIIYAPGLEARCGVRVVFTGRKGGHSAPPFDSTNLSFNVGDRREAVLANRSQVADVMGVPLVRWVLCQQVHGARVSEVRKLDAGRGGTDPSSAVPRTDSLVTGLSGLALGVLVADCVPLVMVSRGTVAVAHAGWRGVEAGIVERALRTVTKGAGSTAGEVLVMVGPHIGPCCMRVGEELAARFAGRFGEACVRMAAGAPFLDLGLACSSRLVALGVKPSNIASTGICTSCDREYFSHRRSGGATGRQAGLVAVLP